MKSTRLNAARICSSFIFLSLFFRATNVVSFALIPYRTTTTTSRIPLLPKSADRKNLLSAATHSTNNLDIDVPNPKRVFFPSHYAGLAFDKYLDWCHRKPFRTKSISAAIILVLGDFLAQSLEANRLGAVLSLDFSRSRGFALSGLFFEGPWMHFWYEQVWSFGRWLKKRFPNLSEKKITLLELTIDQTIGVLAFYPTYFYVYEIFHSLGCGHVPNLASTTVRLKKEILNVFVSQYYIWPLASWFIFRYVPQQLRVLASNSVNVLWNAYLCTRIAM